MQQTNRSVEQSRRASCSSSRRQSAKKYFGTIKYIIPTRDQSLTGSTTSIKNESLKSSLKKVKNPLKTRYNEQKFSTEHLSHSKKDMTKIQSLVQEILSLKKQIKETDKSIKGLNTQDF